MIFFDGTLKPRHPRYTELDKDVCWFDIRDIEWYKKEINNRVSAYKENPKSAVYLKRYYFISSMILRINIDRIICESPEHFEYVYCGLYVHNKITNKTFPLYWGDVVWVSLNIIPDDVNIFYWLKDENEPLMIFCLTIYSVGWKALDRIGWNLSQLHKNVSGWDVKSRPTAVGLFKKMKKGKIRLAFRTNIFVQAGPKLTIYNIDEYITSEKKVTFQDLYLRREVQIFHANGLSACFIVKTKIEALTNLTLAQLKEIIDHFDSMETNAQTYHFFHVWGPTLKKHVKKLEEQ